MYGNNSIVFFTANRSIRGLAILLYGILLILNYTVNDRLFKLGSNVDIGIWTMFKDNDDVTHYTMDVQRYVIFHPSLRHTIGAAIIIALVSDLFKLIFDATENSYREKTRDNHNPWKWMDVGIIDGLLMIVIFQINGEINFYTHVFIGLLTVASAMFSFVADTREIREERGFLTNWKYFFSSVIIQMVLWSTLITAYSISDKETHLADGERGAPSAILGATLTVILGNLFLHINLTLKSLEFFSTDEEDNREYADSIHTFIVMVTRSVVLFIILFFMLNNEEFELIG